MRLLKNRENSKGKNLVKNTIILAIGKFSTQFISLILLPLYTAYLTTAEYGLVDLVTTYVALLVPVVTLQIEMYLFRYLIDCRDKEPEKKKIISNAYFIVLCLSILFILVFIMISKVVEINYFTYLLFILVAIIFSNIILQTSRGLGDNIGYSIACIIIGLTNIIGNLVLILYFNMGITAVFIATIISNFLGSIFLFVRNKIYRYISKKSLNKTSQKEMIKYSLPLVPNGLVWWIINASDRTLITIMIDMSANGIYSVSNKFSNIINNFYGIFNMSWMESVSMYIEDDEDGFLRKTFNIIFNIIASLCLFVISVMFVMFPILIKPEYMEAYKYIPILIISSIFSMLSSNLSAIYIAKKKTKEIATSTIISSILNVVINFIFIKYIGLYAAAISTLISFFILFIIRYIDVQRYVNIKLESKNIFIFTILFVISFLIYEYNFIYLNIVILVVNTIVFYVMNKNEIILVKNKMMRKLKKF